MNVRSVTHTFMPWISIYFPNFRMCVCVRVIGFFHDALLTEKPVIMDLKT